MSREPVDRWPVCGVVDLTGRGFPGALGVRETGTQPPAGCRRGDGRSMAVTEKDVKKALRGVKDPELNLDLVVLGLVYDVEVDGGKVDVTMSLTSPMCPVAGQIVEDARNAVLGVEGVEEADVRLTFDPPWTPERISPLIRASLGL